MKTNEQRLDDLMNFIDSLSRINTADIPDINLYMDQVTTFMDSHLASSLKPGEEKALTKTMINNYAKNNLLWKRASYYFWTSICRGWMG